MCPVLSPRLQGSTFLPSTALLSPPAVASQPNMAPGLFAQGQLIGVQSQQQEAMKTEIKAWDDVASRHPYSVYRKNDYAAYVNKHKNDVFTTSFGTGLPYRVQDRNHRAQTMTEATLKMEQPYPLGYTGHVSETRQVIGQTYGRKVRDAINSVPDVVDGFHSTQELAYRHPDHEVAMTHDRTRRSVSKRPTFEKLDPNSIWTSTSHAGYRPPMPSCYQTPAWSERMTSNIGQLDTYGHLQEKPIHRPSTSSRPSTAAATPLPATNSASRRVSIATPASTSASEYAAPSRRRTMPAAGVATRPDAWVASKKY